MKALRHQDVRPKPGDTLRMVLLFLCVLFSVIGLGGALWPLTVAGCRLGLLP